jgi:amidase
MKMMLSEEVARMALADELAYTTATELAGRIRRRELSPVEVVDACIERIQARNQSLNALVYLGFDEARQRAREAEQTLVSGAEPGVLHGVPTAIKDLFDFTPGWPATFGGIRALRDYTLDVSCAFAERIQQAGAVVVGKTNSPVMGFRGTCDNYLFGPSRNPFDTAKNTGGSSGGRTPINCVPTGHHDGDLPILHSPLEVQSRSAASGPSLRCFDT